MLIQRLSDVLDTWTRRLVMVLVCLLFLNVLVTALLRYAFNISIVSSYDYSRIFFLWCTFLGAGMVFKAKGHAKFVFFYDRTKEGLRFLVDLICNTLYVIFFAVILVVGTKLTISVSAQVLPASGITAAWLYLPILIAAFLMLIHVLSFFHHDFVTFREAKAEVKVGEGVENL
ncbi:TRAP transporter small permease [Ammoniphilus resinae]|uniref:TRAP-type C4-dicarboxylate transport system permease small subunit n=1 Tax=Ammoniphilus resinae TaxID=861532 RepID=A0ABS4GSY1_9BACL|nr:TRAP transporter small permease subunit [Ammoniphilus resinae]MBP1933351.1 TRAP-type C4-dicarboxylate transport system permease small subunit [Ammoniphilus resinae]